MRLNKTQLEAALTALAKANCRANAARNKIMEHAMSVYGVFPGDVDNDAFIDGCDGGCGDPSGMTADEFDQSMREAMIQKGIEMPTSRALLKNPKNRNKS